MKEDDRGCKKMIGDKIGCNGMKENEREWKKKRIIEDERG